LSSRRTLLICIAYLAGLAGLAVAGDRLLADRLFASPSDFVPAYRSAQEQVSGDKLHQLEDSGDIDNLFLGNSRVLFGVDPARLDRALARRGAPARSYNLAMPTVDPRFWDFFLAEYWDKPLPRNVLLGVTPRDLDRRNTVSGQYLDAFRASPAFGIRDRTGIWKWSEEELAQLFTLRGRVEETRRAKLGDVLRGRGIDQRQIDLTGDRGWAAFDPADGVPGAERRRLAARLRDRHGPGLEVGADRLDALDAIYRRVHAAGSCLTLFTTPLLYDREEWGTIEMRRDFYRELREFARTHPGTRILDTGRAVERRYGIADFGDGDHLSPRGAGRFARDLGDALAPSLRSGPCAPR
jgi:hypothetical protein